MNIDKFPSDIRNIAIRLEWDGTSYGGWQIQKNTITVQETVTTALVRILGEEVNLTGCSRTDAGVHARGHISNFKTHSSIPVERLPLALNAMLPETISCIGAEEVSPDFNARYDTIGKTYSYQIYRGQYPSPFLGRFSIRETRNLDICEMKKAATYIEGKHDFKCFMATGSQAKTTVRTVHSLDIEEDGDLLRFIVTGDGFLYNMVRIISGTLLYVGLGKLLSEDVNTIIESGDRRLAGKTLPGKGLFLERVYYRPALFGVERYKP